jgi:PPK2 family polyphosphate:nucleotide phosphotransferase
MVRRPGSAVDLAAIDPRSTPDAPGDKDETRKADKALRKQLQELQVRLRAECERSVVLVLQGMDCAGKDGAIRRVFRGVDPQGIHLRSFKAPSEEELAHDFLWRIHAALPPRGMIGIFNRSHYEDVLHKRVRERAPEDEWGPRIRSIVDFERHLVSCGTTLVKVFLHISKAEQEERLESRLNHPDKRWKYNPHDLEDRKRWDDFQTAYADTISKTSTPGRAVVRRPGGPQVVPELGRADDPRRHARAARPSLPGGLNVPFIRQ